MWLLFNQVSGNDYLYKLIKLIMRQRKAQSSLQGSRTIGNYVLTRNLGEGTFGKVKMGIHSLTGEKVAVKVLQKSKICDVADVERVTREIHILKQVRHPNIIQLYQIIQTPKQLFLVMEYVSEGELFELILKKKRLKQSEACEYFRQLINGVQHLHEIGIVHRDLKPQNLLIDFNKTLKLVDFGLSNTYKPKQTLKTACGSPCYAAPQMIAGKRYNGLYADIWSSGVVLFAMICGYLPFQDPNTSVLYKKITAGDFSIPKFVSPLAREMLHGLLTIDPEKRFKLKDIRSHPWFRTMSDTPLPMSLGIKIGHHSIPIDLQVLEQIKDYNQSIEQTKKYIQNNRHNHSVTIYYLLLKKQLRNGVLSQYDINSPTFDSQAVLKKKEEKEYSEAQTTDLEELQLDRMTTAVGPRSNRIISRLSHLRESKKKDQSVQLKFDLDNLPIVERAQPTQQKKRIHQIILSKNSKRVNPQRQQLLPYEAQPATNRFRQTIAGGFKTSRPSRNVNRSQMKESSDQSRGETFQDRYRSVEANRQERLSIMNRTFLGKMPQAYNPRWENQSERIRSILNTTISGHGKRKQHKLNFYF